MADILVLSLVALYSLFVIRGILRKRKQGVCSGCSSGSCAGCRGCSSEYIDSLIRKAVEEKEGV